MSTQAQTSSTELDGQPRGVNFPACARSGPLFGPNRMKLGVFGLNLSSAGGITAAKDRHEIDWEQNRRLVLLAEKAGFEAAVPVARWRGFEGASNPWGQSFETYTWAAGLAAATSRIAIFSTSHVLTVSPVLAAKQISTIDHISNGRVRRVRRHRRRGAGRGQTLSGPRGRPRGVGEQERLGSGRSQDRPRTREAARHEPQRGRRFSSGGNGAADRRQHRRTLRSRLGRALPDLDELRTRPTASARARSRPA